MNWIRNAPGYPSGTQTRLIEPEGSGLSRLLAVGEAGGEHEERDGLPFRTYAEAGSVLERALYRAGVPRNSLTISNLVPWRPPRNWLDGAPWEAPSLALGRGYLDRLVAEKAPKAILALGGMAMRELTGLSGEKCGISLTRGFVVPGLAYPLPVIGTFHPSFLRRGSKERQEGGPKGKVDAAGGGTSGGLSLLGVLIRDINLAIGVARDGAPKFSYDAYRLGGSLTDWTDALEFLRAHPEMPVSYDFETQDSLVAAAEDEFEIVKRDVTQVQISWRPGQALVSEWFPELLPVLRAILELPNRKMDWNGRKFDRPILRDLGIRTDLGEWHDLMDFWHHAQPDLSRGLQFAASFFCPEVGPWKHLSHSDSLWYGALDVDMPLRIWDGLRRTLTEIRHPLSGVSLAEGYLGQVVKLAPILDRMSARGIPVSEPRRLALDEEFTRTLARAAGEAQALYPGGLKNVSPKAGYVDAPKEMRRECNVCGGTKKIKPHSHDGKRVKQIVCAYCSGRGWLVAETEEFVEREFQAEVKCGCVWSKTKKSETAETAEALDCPRCLNTGKVVESVLRWCRVEPFLPGSWQQVLRYVEFKRTEDISARTAKKNRQWAENTTDWVVPRDYKTGKPTTAADELRRLARKTGDPLLPLVIEYKEVEKMRGTYVRGWKPGEDGRVHPNFGFKPATPQLSSDSPNAQNFPQHAEIAHRMKQMIVAGTGKRFVKFDWKSFFIITGGFEAQDEPFIRIGRIDMHSFVTLVGLLKLERPEVAFAWSSEDLREKLKWWRKQEKLYPEYSRPGFPSGMTFGQIRDYIAKRVIFAWQNGQGPRSLFTLWQETFRDIAEASVCQAELAGLFPKTPKWQTAVRMKADEDHKLITRFGHVRYFWDVFSRKPMADNYQPKGDERIWQNKSTGQKWLLKPGDDHEAVTAYLPNANAYGIKRIALRDIGERGWDEKYGLLADVHDALQFECENRKIDSLLGDVKPLMEAKCPFLVDPIAAPDGLWCEVEAAIGEDWDSWEKIG